MLKPYYKDPDADITIYHGDCLEVMKEFPDKSFDLVLTDPPYGIGICSQGTTVGGAKPFGKKKVYSVGGGKICAVKDYGKQEWDLQPMSNIQRDECMRVSKNQMFFGGNFFNLPPSSCWLVWDKDNTGNFADCELVWTSFKTAVRKYLWRWNGMLQQNMSLKDIRQHPTQKPRELISLIMQDYSDCNNYIIDPFMGSGTTLVAAKELKRRAVGIEISEKYCEIAVKRLKNTIVPMF